MYIIKRLCTKNIEFRKDIIKAIQGAAEDLEIEKRKNGLFGDDVNGDGFRFWDYLNRYLSSFINDNNIIVANTNVCSWSMKLIFEKTSGILYTVMKENRFEDIKRDREKGKKSNYLNALFTEFNSGLEGEISQVCFLNDELNEEYNSNIVSKMIRDLNVEKHMIKNHALILFDNNKDGIISLRCCINNNNFEVVESQDWSYLIEATESIIVENVEEPSEDIKMLLNFTQKTRNKMGHEVPISRKSKEKSIEDEKGIDENE